MIEKNINLIISDFDVLYIKKIFGVKLINFINYDKNSKTVNILGEVNFLFTSFKISLNIDIQRRKVTKISETDYHCNDLKPLSFSIYKNNSLLWLDQSNKILGKETNIVSMLPCEEKLLLITSCGKLSVLKMKNSTIKKIIEN